MNAGLRDKDEGSVASIAGNGQNDAVVLIVSSADSLADVSL